MENVLTQVKHDMLILGGGLSGLAAGYVLAEAGCPVSVFEADGNVGGLARTIERGGYRFDLGGHRFFTRDARINAFVNELMGGELTAVARRSKIFMRGQFFDYPLKPLDAALRMGIPSTIRILGEYGLERIKGVFRDRVPVSLEDWVVARFGRPLFDLFFKQYSEKVWGVDCNKISAEWVDMRIQGLSLFKAVAYAVLKRRLAQLPTLVETFLYPRLGIGRISDRLAESIQRRGRIYTNSGITRINHARNRIVSIDVHHAGQSRTILGDEFISSIPLTGLVKMLDPVPPKAVRTAASGLRFRDLVVLALMVDKPRITDQAWIYIPERDIPFGRIHEPTNWSEQMAPPGKTLLVLEFFSFKDDGIWKSSDRELAETSIEHLERLGFIRRSEVIGSSTVRVPNAYPLFEVGYKEKYNEISAYFSGFKNLHLAGRTGMFRYYNMDHTIRSGMDIAEKIIKMRKTE